MILKYHKCLDGLIRVWCNDWPGDQFEILSADQFNLLEREVNGPYSAVNSQLKRFVSVILIEDDAV